LGDCAATKFAPTAQVAAQQGTYLARLFNTMARTEHLESEIKSLQSQLSNPETKSQVDQKLKQLSKVKLMKPFEYSHQGYPHPTMTDCRLIGVYRK
jgi:NADH:ubiquinone reductase (non-electrogenic)